MLKFLQLKRCVKISQTKIFNDKMSLVKRSQNIRGITRRFSFRAPSIRSSSKPVAGPLLARRFAPTFRALSVLERS